MADPNQKQQAEPPPNSPSPSSSSRRPRAPTITIDTAVSPSLAPEMPSQPPQQGRTSTSSNPPSPQDDAVSPTTTVDPLSGSWASSTKTATQPIIRPELRAATSFDSKDSRPTSPHNVSSPVLPRGKDGAAPTFLSVPSNLRSRQNSVDSDDASRSAVSSLGETAVASSSQPETSAARKRPSSELSNERIMNDGNALKPDVGSEADFEVENNPYAFSPGQLNKMFNPKSLSAFYQLGGLRGIEKGMQSDRKSGLNAEETNAPRRVTFQEATQSAIDPTTPPPTKLESEGLVGDSKEKEPRPSTSMSHRRHHHDGHDAGHFADRIRVFKDNRLPEKKGKSLLQLMWITYNDKVLMLLTAAAVVSLAVGLYQALGIHHEPTEPKVEYIEGLAIIAAIAIVVVVGSLNDYQKERQFARLNQKKQDRLVKVIRSGKPREISVFDILVGDVIHLEPGDLVPVDGILIEGFDIKCDESQATGESDVIKKQASDVVFNAIQNHSSTKKLDPFIQSGARVMEGVGTFMCTSTGVYSTYGRTLMALNDDPEITPLQSKLNVIAEYIAKIGGAAGLLLFIVLFIFFLARLPKSPLKPEQKGQSFLEIFIVVVTIIVVAVPEGLPLAVTLALAFATNRMLKDNNLVRHLKACEVMGNATTICSDKTGTLTQNKMKVVAGTIGTTHRWGRDRPVTPTSDDESEVSVADNGPEVSGAEIGRYMADEARNLVVQSVAVNSTAFESDEKDKNNEPVFIGSKTETALLLYARDLGMGPLAIERSNATVLQLFPFDSGRKCMGVVISLGKGRARFYVKGASEIVLGKCTQMWADPRNGLSTISMTTVHRETVNKLINYYASNSLRTIGMAYKDFEQWPPRMAKRADDTEVLFEDLFRNMVFTAMVGIQDPLREGVPEAVRLCQKAGVVVRMVTGDNKLTAEAIARECGILQPNSIVMEGPEFRNMTKAQQEQIIPRLHVLARSSPEDKRILVKRLKDKFEIVAVTGDGTNDAPALRMADVGFSMGIAGTEVAKEASSIILMDDNFNSIVKALKWGRAVNDAVKRFLQFQLTVNVTAVVLTFVSSVVSSIRNDNETLSVLTAVQLLWVNLIMDTLAALALATDPPQDSILNRRPEPRNASIISTTMWKMILGQAIYQLTITFILFFGGKSVLPDTGEYELGEKMLSTLVFNTFVWMQIFNQWNNRRLDNNFNIFEGITRNWIFIAISVGMCASQVLIIFFTKDAFKINPAPTGKIDPQGPVLWAVAIVLGFISIPVGMVIRLIPDQLLEKCIPQSWIRKAQGNVPGVTVSDEEAFDYFPSPLADVRDELAFLKRIKGGRINNLKFAMRHPRETLMQRSRSPSHSRSSSIKTPQTPTREDSFGSMLPPTPETRKRSKSMRSRSNSALGAPTVMAGIVAAGVAAGWSPIDRSVSREDRDTETSTLNNLSNTNTNNNNGPQNQNPSRASTE